MNSSYNVMNDEELETLFNKDATGNDIIIFLFLYLNNYSILIKISIIEAFLFFIIY